MPRYLARAAYTAASLAALVSNPQDRMAGLRALVEQLGGRLDSADYCLGDDDIVVTFTVPDDATAAALALRVAAAGHLRHYKTMKLLAPDEFLAALTKAQGATYQAPAGRAAGMLPPWQLGQD